MNYKLFSLILSFCLLNALNMHGNTSNNKDLRTKENNDTHQVKQKEQKTKHSFFLFIKENLLFIKEKINSLTRKLTTLIHTYYIKLRYPYPDPRWWRHTDDTYYLGQPSEQKEYFDNRFPNPKSTTSKEWNKWDDKTKEDFLVSYYRGEKEDYYFNPSYYYFMRSPEEREHWDDTYFKGTEREQWCDKAKENLIRSRAEHWGEWHLPRFILTDKCYSNECTH